MKTTDDRNQIREDGFAIPARASYGIRHAVLVAEDEEGRFQPLCVVSSINEAGDTAASDLKCRLDPLGRDEDPGICPYEHKVLPRGIEGKYITLVRISATDGTMD